MQNLNQSVAFRATTLFTTGWRPVHNFLLMFGIELNFDVNFVLVCTFQQQSTKEP